MECIKIYKPCEVCKGEIWKSNGRCLHPNMFYMMQPEDNTKRSGDAAKVMISNQMCRPQENH